jgi:DNA-binding protein H-NS
MVTLKSIQEKIAKLQAQAAEVAKKESSAVFEKIGDLMKKHGLTTEDIAAHFRSSTAAHSAKASTKSTAHAGAAKYRDPKTGATWTGHGRAPAWIAKAKDRSKFLATDGGVSSEAVRNPTTKPGNYPRGPQAPKYRDPATGATWSGRGPAPAWLASAKDRTDYLIDKTSAASADATPAKTSTKTAAKKLANTSAKTAVKEATAKKVTAKKAAVKNAAVKNAAAKKVAAKKAAPVAKKAAAKKVAVKRAPAKKVASKTAPTTTPTTAPDASGAAESTSA